MLVPPSVREELGEEHLSVFVHEMVERLDLRQMEAGRSVTFRAQAVSPLSDYAET